LLFAFVLSKQAVKHINMDIRLVAAKAEGRDTTVKLVVWHGARKHVACLRTVKSLIQNMITGVTKGFRYKVKAVYAHFPINVIVNDGGRSVEIRNFLGEKVRCHSLKMTVQASGAGDVSGRAAKATQSSRTIYRTGRKMLHARRTPKRRTSSAFER
jgi:ribosomal protein L6P/L9E